ncbi:NTP transferase domain-containing protein [Candidatus Gracilibacteria bacterium]|nr:NTP transferase domain-containing protein [Candidatus Gracilibacteria bacterium]MCF7855933.1 NTP transferase domain-containing protein [Candidatus Gracilibacteria bacterium]MCF7896374.1 NTP transferase domain-containing protein [Candidatus Gracilibacteria bacterium]
MQKSLQILILAGGVGTRLWPMSRQKLPKQFQPLVGSQTLFQLAVARARKLTSPQNIFVATNAEFTKLVQKQAPTIPTKNIIAEPAFRDTATCLGFAAAILEARNPGAVFAVVYADNLIREEKEFIRKIRAAAEIAKLNKLAIVEVESSFPSTQYGWVEVARQLPSVQKQKVFAIKRFVEKPNLLNAKKFHVSPKFFWNTGLLVCRSDYLLEKFQTFLPDTFTRLQKMAAANFTPKVVVREYSACQKISIDFAILEKIPPAEIAILPAKLGWSDVGSWESLKNELSRKEENLVDGEFQAVDSTGNFVKTASPKFVALVGVKNLVVVETADAILICAKEKSGEVKKIVQALEKKGKLL